MEFKRVHLTGRTVKACYALLAQLVRAPDLCENRGMVTRYSLAIEIGSSNLSSYAKSGGSKFDPWAEHHCGVEKWSSRHPHKVKIGSSNLPSRNQMLPWTSG